MRRKIAFWVVSILAVIVVMAITWQVGLINTTVDFLVALGLTLVGVATVMGYIYQLTEKKQTEKPSPGPEPQFQKKTPSPPAPTTRVVDISNVESSGINIAGGDITRTDRIIGTQVFGDQYKAQTIYVNKEGKETRIPLIIPPRSQYFQGRESELQKLLADLQPGKIVTICGPGGIGKTALASEAIWQLTENGTRHPDLFPDGVLFHTFYNQPSSDVALEAIALAYGLEPRPTPLAAAQIALSNRCALLVLDGAEAADDLKKVLDVRGYGAVLVTSRDRADLFESGQDISPLETEYSLALLKDWGGDQIDDDEVARRICELVGNLPLAVRLAGSYLAVNKEKIGAYTQWLESSPLSALNHGERRSESVSVLLERSLEAVGEDAGNALAVIGLLALAPFDRFTITATLDLPEDRAGRALNELVRFGLLLRPGSLYQVSHALVHTFARQTLVPPDSALERLADHYIQLVQVMREKGLEGFQELDAVRPHLITLLEGLKDNKHWKTVITLSWLVEDYLDLQGRWQERIQVCNYALHAAQSMGDRREEGAWLGNRGLVYAALGQVERAIEYQKQALMISKEIGDRHGEGNRLGNLGLVYADQWHMDRAIEYHQQALAIAQEIGDRHGEGNRLGNLGNAYFSLGQVERAIEYYQQALQISKDIGDRRFEGNNLGNLGNAYADLGQVERAIEYYQQALQIAQEIGDRGGEGSDLGNLGNAYAELAQVQRAIEYFQQALQIAQEIGDRRCSSNQVVPGKMGILNPSTERCAMNC